MNSLIVNSSRKSSLPPAWLCDTSVVRGPTKGPSSTRSILPCHRDHKSYGQTGPFLFPSGRLDLPYQMLATSAGMKVVLMRKWDLGEGEYRGSIRT